MRTAVSSYFLVLALVTVFLILPAEASTRTTETQVTVRALSKGAKFIGSSMGGAKITIRNLETGELLASGKTTGSTGNTDRIMRQEHGRTANYATPDAAKYTTSLWLSEPTKVKITAEGPLSNPADANATSTTLTLLPGKDLTAGDAVRLEIPGFVVDIVEPEETWLAGDTSRVTVRARISLMCGCPITPGGLWNSRDYELKVALYSGLDKIKEIPMQYAGEPSLFTATVELEEPGCYDLMVYAYDPITGNTGYERVTCTAGD